MKGLETALFGLTLLLVPLLAWLAGRMLGRRDGRIGSVVVVGALAALLPYLARLALVASADVRPFGDAFTFQMSRSFGFTEVGLFFASFGIFMTMLGWTATPVHTKLKRPLPASLPR